MYAVQMYGFCHTSHTFSLYGSLCFGTSDNLRSNESIHFVDEFFSDEGFVNSASSLEQESVDALTPHSLKYLAERFATPCFYVSLAKSFYPVGINPFCMYDNGAYPVG